MFFKIFSCLMVLLLFSMPCFALAQQTSDAAQAIADATRDARDPTMGHIWFPAGCCLGFIGVVIASAYTPSPPAIRLLGKSPEYIAYYTETYQKVARDDQVTEAAIGCLVGAILWGAAYYYILSSDLYYRY